jgi:hypothetical protein
VAYFLRIVDQTGKKFLRPLGQYFIDYLFDTDTTGATDFVVPSGITTTDFIDVYVNGKLEYEGVGSFDLYTRNTGAGKIVTASTIKNSRVHVRKWL